MQLSFPNGPNCELNLIESGWGGQTTVEEKLTKFAWILDEIHGGAIVVSVN
jgi:hypothetical protein